ncbi:MAG: hypothetical protein JO249_01585 [Acidobacteria bacterium]|nr:hypothetical protein [Acidobacteriota bacterium]
MATKQQWAEVFRHYEARAQVLVTLHVRLELLRQENEPAAQPAGGAFIFERSAMRWFDANP